MATTSKGEQVEPGIWRQPDGKPGYLAEINYADPSTGKRVRERKSIHRIDLAREWRQTRKADALRGEVRRRKDEPKPKTFRKFADEYAYFGESGHLFRFQSGHPSERSDAGLVRMG
jgi:hypothetical protein